MVIWLFFSPFPRKIKRQKVLSSRNFNSSVRVLFLSVTYPSISLFISFTCLITSLTRESSLKPRRETIHRDESRFFKFVYLSFHAYTFFHSSLPTNESRVSSRYSSLSFPFNARTTGSEFLNAFLACALPIENCAKYAYEHGNEWENRRGEAGLESRYSRDVYLRQRGRLFPRESRAIS